MNILFYNDANFCVHDWQVVVIMDQFSTLVFCSMKKSMWLVHWGGQNLKFQSGRKNKKKINKKTECFTQNQFSIKSILVFGVILNQMKDT